MRKIVIYVSTFGQKVLNQEFSIPIEVGSSLRSNYIYPLKDNIGDNISIENPFFGELTGLYWIWKNCKMNSDDIIGFFHYNKGLDISINKIFKLKRNEWIVLNKCKNNSHPIIEEISATRRIIAEKYPFYLSAWDKAYRGDGSGDICNAAQLFITTYEEFLDYCEFLFGVLFELRTVIGEGSDSAYLKRYCAFVGERLLTVYLIANNKEIIECGMKYQNKIKTILSRILLYTKYDRNSSTYKFFQRKFGIKSSYKK